MEDLNCDGTVTSVTRYNSVRLIRVLATHLGMDTDHLALKSACLNGDLVEGIWMVPPPGIGVDSKILGLNKALHGLKQVLLSCFEKLSESLAQIGYM